MKHIHPNSPTCAQGGHFRFSRSLNFNRFRAHGALIAVITALVVAPFSHANARRHHPTPTPSPTATPTPSENPNDPGIVEPCLSATSGTTVRIPHTDQADGQTQLNIDGNLVTDTDARGALSLLGSPITETNSPNGDMKEALKAMADAAKDGKTSEMQSAATDLMNILLGTTSGRIYDGFPMLNFNRGGLLPDQVPGEYKMKTLQDTGLTEPGIDGVPRKIWEANVNLLYYDGQIDSDTFLLRVPAAANEFDTVRIHYRIYSLVREDFSPTVVMQDKRLEGSVQFPFKGFDAVWVALNGGKITELTVKMPPVRLLRGVYTWGWRVHPPRIQFLQPIYEQVNAHTGNVELEPEGQSYAFRNRELSIDGISDAAPEKKMYIVAQAALNGESTTTINDWLTKENDGPRGTWDAWADLAANQRQLPPEAWDILAQEGIEEGKFGPYRMVTVYMNNEMYGEGPNGSQIEGWNQGARFQVKLINLDQHTHYFRNVDFGSKLHDDIARSGASSGSHSFEIMNFKPFYGAPKVAEAQWRAGWGFRPHFDVIQGQDCFPRSSDQVMLKSYLDGHDNERFGYQYSDFARQGDFRFNPPNAIIGTPADPSPFLLREGDGSPGLAVGQLTEGYGFAGMCSQDEFPFGTFCARDISAYNPDNLKNIDTDGDGVADVLWFPPFLRNPNPNGGDIIPPTPAWKPFLFINPNNGTLFLDPNDESKGYWVDLTYAHGTPIKAGASLNANIEAPRGSAQVFYQFDDLFHDNDIFSPHPTFETR